MNAQPIRETAPTMPAVAWPERIIFAEFNELCPWLIDDWIAAGKLPNFRRLKAQSVVFDTLADAPEGPHLEPWIQWYSLHTGLSYDQHNVFHLTEGTKAQHQDIWRAAHEAGHDVGCFSSMNVRGFDFPGSFYVGDPWSESGDAAPAELNIYNRFIGQNVREYSNTSARLGLSDYARFLGFMIRRGLKVKTVRRILSQLVLERVKHRKLAYKRVALMDRMQFDVFRHFQRTHRPAFSTFFINSTAHLQHSYWRQMQPEPFTVKPSPQDVSLYGDAILFGYQAMDDLLGEFITLADECGATLMFMTALSQQPFLRAEEQGGKHFHRMHDVEAFFRSFSIPYANIDPTMTHQYMATFANDADKTRAKAFLTGFATADGGPVFGINSHEGDGLYFGCDIGTAVDPASSLTTPDGSITPFSKLFYTIDATKSGRHHPCGALWVRTGAHKKVAEAVSILDIFPTTLELLGIEAVASPDALPRRGTSLAKHIRD